jgi:hypothetical protein
MPENLPSEQGPDQQLKRAIAERVTEQLAWLDQAAKVVGGPDATVPDVFDLPPEVRDDAPMPDWTPEQVDTVREIGRRMGYGAHEDVSSGLRGSVCIAEGGKVWKMMAEAEAINGQEDARTLVFAGSPFRPLGDDEHKFLAEVLGTPKPEGATEYDAAVWLARSHTDPRVQTDPVTIHFGYGVEPGNPFVAEATGQLIHFGQTSKHQSVQVLRVDREPYEEDGRQKYRYQPDTMRLMTFMAQVLNAQGDTGLEPHRPKLPVVLETSNTYASRVVGAIRAGLAVDRQFGVGMYGRNTIHELGAPLPKETSLNQLPGDFRVMHDELQQLRTEVAV